jgi:hypothetical protein
MGANLMIYTESSSIILKLVPLIAYFALFLKKVG